MRKYPNIAISGTPGTGKTTLAKLVAENVEGMSYIDFGKEAEARDCREEYDDKLQTWVINEDRLADLMIPDLNKGGKIIDWIHADFWPTECPMDLVITMRADNTLLFDRYKERGYQQEKIEQNIDSEIYNQIGEENTEYYGDEDTTLVELHSNSNRDMENNLQRLIAWIRQWRKDNAANGSS